MVHHSFNRRNFPPSFPKNRKEQKRYDYSPCWIYLGLLPCQSNSTCKFSRGCSYTYRSKSSHIKVISRVTSLVQCFLFLGNILATLPSGRLVFCMTQNPSQSIFFYVSFNWICPITELSREEAVTHVVSFLWNKRREKRSV